MAARALVGCAVIVGTSTGLGRAAKASPFDEMVAAARADCAKAAREFPAADRQPAPPVGCKADRAYYGIGQPVDFQLARTCALQQPSDWNLGVLAMLYANGQGVPRNLALARKAVCDAGGAPIEVQDRLAHLARIEQALADETEPETFDLCDDATSGYLTGYCARLGAQIADAHREAQISAMSATWPAADRPAFETLRRALAAFSKARDGEVDQTGTARASMMFEAEQATQDAFFALLSQAQAQQLPALPAERAAAADAALNETWSALKATHDTADTTVTFAGIVTAQRAWLAYRDAWVAFGTRRWPALPRSTWLALLTEQRTQTLRDLLQDRQGAAKSTRLRTP